MEIAGATVVTRPLHVLAVASWCVGLCMAHEGGCHGEPGATRPSPVNAIGMVLEHADGTVEARLSVRSDTVESATPVRARDVALSTGADRHPLEGDAGSYAALLDGVAYEPEVPFTLSFSVDGATAREHRIYAGRFSMSAHGPWDRPQAWLEERELFWTPGGLPAYVEVRDAGGDIVWQRFDPFAEAPDFDAMAPGGATLPDAAIAEGSVVVVCAVEAMGRDELAAAPQHVTIDVDLEGRLGWLSGMVVGRCTSLAL